MSSIDNHTERGNVGRFYDRFFQENSEASTEVLLGFILYNGFLSDDDYKQLEDLLDKAETTALINMKDFDNRLLTNIEV